MHTARRTFVATGLVALLAVAGVTAAIAADPAPPPPPRIAFLANGIVPADALAAGPIAGQLGAPVYTTQQGLLPAGTADALTAYNPELVIVMGGPVAISDAVITQVSTATGLPAVDPTPAPAAGVVRAAGDDRFETATIVADLLAAYTPAYLPVDLQAVDADLLDGKDASEFQPAGNYLAADGKAKTAGHADTADTADTAGTAETAGDADTLNGLSDTDLLVRQPVATAHVDRPTPGLLFAHNVTEVTRPFGGVYCLRLSPSLGLTGDEVYAQVTPEHSNSAGQDFSANWQSIRSDCPDDDQVEILTFEAGSAADTVSFVATLFRRPS